MSAQIHFAGCAGRTGSPGDKPKAKNAVLIMKINLVYTIYLGKVVPACF